MGLNTTHGCWDGPYSAFHDFRETVAAVAGIPLCLMEGFYGKRERDIAPREWDVGILPIPWKVLAADPLHLFLNHSDCDGDIPVQQQLAIAERLEELAEKLDEPHRADALRFAKGLRLANSCNEPVRFQ